jgi:hypothetical protein
MISSSLEVGLSDKKWPHYQRDEQADHMHAMGVLVTNWQIVEDAYHALFQLMNPGNVSFAFHAFDMLGNDSRAELIRAEFARVVGAEYQEPIQHFLTMAAISKENRNAIAHASYGPDSNPDIVNARKGLDKTRTSVKQYRFTVAGLREMADHTAITAGYGMRIFSRITMQQALAGAEWPREASDSLRAALPLLDKPPLPRKWHLHSQPLPEIAPPQPEPSRK